MRERMYACICTHAYTYYSKSWCVCVHKYVCVRAFANHSLIFLLLLAIFTDHLIYA